MYSQNSNSEIVLNFIRRRKTNLKSVFNSKCCLCGFDEVQEALEFHHVNPEEKSFAICGSNNQTKALKPQLEEMKKCILVCANCHRGIHYNIYQVPENWKDFYDEKIAEQLLQDLEAKKYFCKYCGNEVSRGYDCCSKCSHLMQQTCERPTREELKTLIREKPFTQIASLYNVTDNAIRKWCDAYNLPRKKTDINNYSTQEWEKI